MLKLKFGNDSYIAALLVWKGDYGPDTTLNTDLLYWRKKRKRNKFIQFILTFVSVFLLKLIL